MGRKQHENQRFHATMKLINASFESCTLLIVDALYRHTLRIEYPEKNDLMLYNKAVRAGNSWLERNKKAYQNLSIPCKIIHWARYLDHPRFQAQFQTICHLYETDQEYQNAVNTDAKTYLERYLARSETNNMNYRIAFSACVQYLKEESAGMCLWIEDGYDFEVYPTGRCATMRVTYEKLIRPFHPTLLRPVGIRFKKKPI